MGDPARYAYGVTEITSLAVHMQASGFSKATTTQRCRLLKKLIHDQSRQGVERLVADVSIPAKRVYVAQLRAAFETMRHANIWCGPDPTIGVRVPRAPMAAPRPLTEQQVAQLLAGVPERERVWSVLGVYAGLRASETVKWTPADLVDTVHGPGLVVTGKGNKTAVIPAHPEVVALADCDGWAVTAPSYLSALWKAAAVGAGLPATVRYHQLRHTYATRLLRRTGDLMVTRDLMRHSSVATTQRYTAVAQDRLWAAIA